ncbi:hypothetical protein IE53DRAFT_136322 [Violaceomyces palustris]|uniref:Uncharacterized protein n=1 Tax=Violaceomyces palustris TaxID=1673888 RepID=A0ACD0NUT2_9BASI|nr:hypothetical protein IE53DRAFT_136322 [Violaceomyces palustris]
MARSPPSLDNTQSFKSLINQRSAQYPPASSCSSSSSSSRKPKQSTYQAALAKENRQWTSQAYTIRRHIINLLSFLYSIRRQYLSLSNRYQRGGGGVPPLHFEEQDQPDSIRNSSYFAKWQKLSGPLDEKQRDEIDFQVKVVIKRCLESIRELEHAEQERKKLSPTTPTALSPLNSLISLSRPRDSADSIQASSLLSAHRSSIISYLSNLLSVASAIQSDMQERRLRAQMERSRTLASTRERLLSSGGGKGSEGSTTTVGKNKDENTQPILKGSVGGSFERSSSPWKTSSNQPAKSPFSPELEGGLEKGQDIIKNLSKQQIQQLEQESSDLVKSLEAELESIRKAESRLHEISDLQNQVSIQLEQQNEVTDRLLDDAISVGTDVGRGNQELSKARKRSREADKYLSFFLVGSGLTLLFLHWMD